MSRRVWKVNRDGLPPIIDALDRLAGWRPPDLPTALQFQAHQPSRIVGDVLSASPFAGYIANGRVIAGQGRLVLIREALVAASLTGVADELERRLFALQNRVRDWEAAALATIQREDVADWNDEPFAAAREEFEELADAGNCIAEWLRRTNRELKVYAKSKKPPRALTPDQAVALDIIRKRGPIPGDALAAAVGVEPETVRGWCQRTGALYLHGVRNRTNAGYFLPAATTPEK